MKTLLIIALLLPASSQATKLTCTEAIVAIKVLGGPENAEGRARAMGVSEETITFAKECLRKRPVQSIKH